MIYGKNDKLHIKLIKAGYNLIANKDNVGEVYLDKIKSYSELMEKNQNPQFEQDFLDIMRLAVQSKIHQQYTLLQAVEYFVPPIMLNYHQIYKENNSPKSVITIGFISEESAKNMFFKQTRPIQFEDFNSGDNAWMVDLIAPDGDIVPVIKQLSNWGAENGYEGKQCHWVRTYPNGKKKLVDFKFKRSVWDVK